MKQWKLKKLLQVLTLGACLSPWSGSYAAQQQMLWGKTDNYTPLLKQFSLIQPTSIPKGLRLPTNLSTNQNTTNSFQLVSSFIDNSGKSHLLYAQYYQGLPVFEKTLGYHVSNKGTAVTGTIVSGIEKDVKDLKGKLTIEQVKKIALGKNTPEAGIFVEKIIFFDEDTAKQAILAYHVSYGQRTNDGSTMPSFIIDANTGKILQQWNNLPTIENGQGVGGNLTVLPYRPGNYQFGTSQPGVNSLGMLDGTPVSNNECVFSNTVYRVLNLKNRAFPTVPVSYQNEPAPFYYFCNTPILTDNFTAPINNGLSPVGDVAYFLKKTIDMLRDQYGLQTQINGPFPLRAYTHSTDTGAFACSARCMAGKGIYGPPQLVFGNGDPTRSPLTEGDIIAHEYGHLVTDRYSSLSYQEQAGGMNEAFSDMTGMAINYYVRTNLGYPWYWDGADWTTGRGISKAIPPRPTRYFNDPTLDGRSIGNARNYVPGMDPHLSSGVYNRLFYLMSTSPGWSIDMAYRVMLGANTKYYWQPQSNFYSGACGVLTSAQTLGYPTAAITTAFTQVGIWCGLDKKAIAEVADI